MAKEPKDPKEQKKPTAGLPPCKADKELEYLIRARYNLIYVVTWEEGRVIDSLRAICDMDDINLGGVQVWDAARGLFSFDENGNVIHIEGGENILKPEDMLDYIFHKAEDVRGKILQSKAARGPVFVLCDLFRYFRDGMTPELERKIRVLSWWLKKTTMSVVITSPDLVLPTALEKCVAVFDYPLPGKEQLGVVLGNAKNTLVARKKIAVDGTPDESIVRSLMGLTVQEAEDAIAKTAVVKNKLDIPTLIEIKRQIIRKGQLLEYVCSENSLEDVGGFKGVKQFVRLRKNAFTDKAAAYGLPCPKGVFLAGVQGSGKSLCAKAISNELQVPMLKLDMGKMFGSELGASESNMRRALQIAESVAPCVLFVDEIDQALSGATGIQTDSGTTKRVIGNLLNWMQEKASPVFLVACCNSIAGLPPALLRKGRFDELFFVDLPQIEERAQIFEIHIRKRGRDPKKYDLEKLSSLTDKFSGAEIEGVVLDAMFNAFDDNREFGMADIEKAIKTCVPLSTVMKEELDKLREDARGRMRLASKEINDDKPELQGDGSRFDQV